MGAELSACGKGQALGMCQVAKKPYHTSKASGENDFVNKCDQDCTSRQTYLVLEVVKADAKI
jgi:hypothetical protein